MKEERLWLQDILDAINRIEKYAKRGRKAFNRNELIQVWVIYQLVIIGEAARSLSKSFRTTYNDIPWSSIIGARNVYIHQFFDIDLDLVWSVIENDIPDLKRKIEEILNES